MMISHALAAGAGIYAQRAGYVDTGIARVYEGYAPIARDNGLPALPTAKTLDALVNRNMDVQGAITTAFEQSTAQVAAGLAAARELFSSYFPDYPTPAGGGGGGSELALATAPASGAGGGVFRGGKGPGVLLTLVFLAGAGSGAAVYYLGPERVKQLADQSLSKARVWARQTGKWADAQAASLGLKVYLDAAGKHLHVAAAHAGAIASHPQLLAAQSAVGAFATQTALPALRLGAESCAAHAQTAYDVAKPHVVTAVEVARPHVVALIQYGKDIVAVVLAYVM
eukprot:CAMPEP_0197581260 /NCGR_PEP_ID=MMETSP1326-20131121/4835_1 /TAXON_ID=1155430 /ORGANISM="Genus nov. species nov., Strain RCC2288" /LENGTH=282 /DNA_ID=CAMNT_0043145143 /DNA_START=112 /DNA_END=960 /DNA_ORIENTATION=-